MKTEKQKAAEGLLYDANNDPELQQEMLQTRCLLHEYNLLPPDRTDERDRLIRRIVHMGEGGCIISPFYCDYGYHIRIGRNFFANTNLVILDGADVTIGDNVFIAPTWVSIPPAIRSTSAAATQAWSMPTPSASATTCG